MSALEKVMAEIKNNPRQARFEDVKLVCTHVFGSPRIHGSHYVFKTPWSGDPRVNIQNRKGYVAPYQVKQVLAAIERWRKENA